MLKTAIAALGALLFLAAPGLAQDTKGPGPATAHLDAAEYLARRATPVTAALPFTVTIQADDGSATIQARLGPDYVATTFSGEGEEWGFASSEVWDLRLRRRLRLEEDGTFSNVSLFGVFQSRFALFQNNVGAFGQLAFLVAGGDQEAMMRARFAAEAANGLDPARGQEAFAAPPPVIVSAEAGPGAREARIGDAAVGRITYDGGPPFPSDAHRAALAAWLAWGLGVHPAIAAIAAEGPSVPTGIVEDPTAGLTGKALEAIDGVGKRVTIDLSGFGAVETTPFPLDADARSASIAWPPHISRELAGTLIAATRGDYGDGPPSEADYVAEIERVMEDGEPIELMLLSLYASIPFDKCRASLEEPLCQSMLTGAQRASRDLVAAKIGAALEHGQQGRPGDGVTALRPLEAHVADSPYRHILDVMIANDLVEAGRSGQLPLEESLTEARGRFERGLAADPYNPARYRDLFNYVYAVGGLDLPYEAYERGYVIGELGRVLPDRPVPPLLTSLDDLEAQIAADFPVLFPPSLAE